MLKKITVLTVLFLTISGFNNEPHKIAVEKAIKEYSGKGRIIKKYSYSELIIDTSTYSDYFVFQFYPSNQKRVLFEDDFYFPNRIDSIGSHKVIWYDKHNSKRIEVIEELSKIRMIDSFYFKKSLVNYSDLQLDKIDNPTYIIDEKMKPYCVYIMKNDINRVLKSCEVRVLIRKK